ncbi:MAG: guanylate kinase [Burkholderiaceae bacterium]|nr:guanylate kinase [Burkholderiaceae bacterium]
MSSTTAKSSGSLFMVVAPSGAGKSTLVNALLAQDPSIRLSISCTTRAPREGEVNGREYHFLTVDEFFAARERGEFLEWAEIYGNYYGTSSQRIAAHVQSGADVLLEIDWQGAQQMKKLFPEAVGIFILPPSIAVLEERLTKRGKDAPDVIARRVMAAGSEIAHAGECEYVIINQSFAAALAELSAVIAAARCRFSQQAVRNAQLFAELGIAPAAN